VFVAALVENERTDIFGISSLETPKILKLI